MDIDMFCAYGEICSYEDAWADIKKDCNCCDNFMIKCKPSMESFNKMFMDDELYTLDRRSYMMINKNTTYIQDFAHFFKEITYLKWEKNDSKIIEDVKREEWNFNCYKQLAWYYCNDMYIYNFAHFMKKKGYAIEDIMFDYLYWSFGDPREAGNYFYDRFESKEQKYYISEMKQRKFQGDFRKKLLNKYKVCQICGLENEDMLVASHIKSYSECNSFECADINNGFLLCKTHDGWFDNELITFEDNGNILISKKISSQDRILGNINEDIKISLEQENLKYLKHHRKKFFKNEKL